MKDHTSKRIAATLVAAGLAAFSCAANATVVDLTGDNDSGTLNGVQFDWRPAQPTGTGVIQPFVRVQADMFNRFGDSAKSEGGFEERSLVNNVSPVPEVSALFPIIGLLAAVSVTTLLRRRRLAQLLASSSAGH